LVNPVKRSLVQYLAFVTAIYAIRESKSHMFENNNKKNFIIEKDPLDSKLMILDWILYEVCGNEKNTS